MKINELTVVVCCNKDDYYFARICVASVRYYYPDIRIELVKDTGKGEFNTTEVEKYFDVVKVDLGVKKMGWSAAKFLYLYKFPAGKKLLMLDADIVFISPFIESILPLFSKNDYVVSIEKETNPYSDWVKGVYFDTHKIELADPHYKFPGYFFNAGQIFVTTGSIEKKILDEYFDVNNYPFWKQAELFPLVDQSVYNYLLPTLHIQDKIKLGTADFMVWSRGAKLTNITLKQVINKQLTKEGLIHWAGDLRTPFLKKMNRADILLFFEDFYYKGIDEGKLMRYYRKGKEIKNYFFKKVYNKLSR